MKKIMWGNKFSDGLGVVWGSFRLKAFLGVEMNLKLILWTIVSSE